MNTILRILLAGTFVATVAPLRLLYEIRTSLVAGYPDGPWGIAPWVGTTLFAVLPTALFASTVLVGGVLSWRFLDRAGIPELIACMSLGTYAMTSAVVVPLAVALSAEGQAGLELVLSLAFAAAMVSPAAFLRFSLQFPTALPVEHRRPSALFFASGPAFWLVVAGLALLPVFIGAPADFVPGLSIPSMTLRASVSLVLVCAPVCVGLGVVNLRASATLSSEGPRSGVNRLADGLLASLGATAGLLVLAAVPYAVSRNFPWTLGLGVGAMWVGGLGVVGSVAATVFSLAEK